MSDKFDCPHCGQDLRLGPDAFQRLAEREKELRNANRGAETNFKMTDLALKEKAVIQKKAERYREALEKIAANPYNKDYCRGVCPQIAKAALERRHEGEGSVMTSVMASSENSVRRLAEKVVEIITNSEGGEYDHSYSLPEIESLLSEAMDRSYAKAQVEWAMRPSTDSAKEARSAAYRDAIEIVETYIWFEDGSVPMPLDNRYRKEIADKLRRKASE